MTENVIDLLFYGTGTVAEYMRKSLILTVNIRNKVFRTFRQIQDRLQIDDLCRSR